MKKAKLIKFRRKREGVTNYRKRLTLLSSNKPRLITRKSLKNIISQIVEYNVDGDKIILSASSKELKKKYGWKFNRCNLPAAYLTGLLLGAKARKKNIKNAVVDLGLNKSVKGSKMYAVLKGVLDAGLQIPHSKDILPSDNAVKGDIIVKYYEAKKSDKMIFTKYKKDGLNISDLPKTVDSIKKQILEGK